MRKLFLAVLVTALAGVLAATALAARTVKVGDNYFVRDNGDHHRIAVAKNTRVVFKWVDGGAHSVAATDGPERFKSKVKSGGTYRHRFDKRGTYKLVCKVHPTLMRLTVRVK